MDRPLINQLTEATSETTLDAIFFMIALAVNHRLMTPTADCEESSHNLQLALLLLFAFTTYSKRLCFPYALWLCTSVLWSDANHGVSVSESLVGVPLYNHASAQEDNPCDSSFTLQISNVIYSLFMIQFLTNLVSLISEPDYFSEATKLLISPHHITPSTGGIALGLFATSAAQLLPQTTTDVGYLAQRMVALLCVFYCHQKIHRITQQSHAMHASGLGLLSIASAILPYQSFMPTNAHTIVDKEFGMIIAMLSFTVNSILSLCAVNQLIEGLCVWNFAPINNEPANNRERQARFFPAEAQLEQEDTPSTTDGTQHRLKEPQGSNQDTNQLTTP